MNAGYRRNTPFWRASEARTVRPEGWVMAVVVVGMLMVQVWQSSRLAEDCMKLDRLRKTLAQERSKLEFDHERLAGDLTRSQLEPVAARLGLKPVDGEQQIDVPASYLASEGAVKTVSTTSRMAWLDRVSRALIPEATARSRSGS
jgi:hypothetical protein